MGFWRIVEVQNDNSRYTLKSSCIVNSLIGVSTVSQQPRRTVPMTRSNANSSPTFGALHTTENHFSPNCGHVVSHVARDLCDLLRLIYSIGHFRHLGQRRCRRRCSFVVQFLRLCCVRQLANGPLIRRFRIQTQRSNRARARGFKWPRVRRSNGDQTTTVA